MRLLAPIRFTTAPATDSDAAAEIVIRRTADGLLQVMNASANQVLSGAVDPIDGTTVAWYVNQPYINTTNNTLWYATAKSSDPDAAGAGSTWAPLSGRRIIIHA